MNTNTSGKVNYSQAAGHFGLQLCKLLLHHLDTSMLCFVGDSMVMESWKPNALSMTGRMMPHQAETDAELSKSCVAPLRPDELQGHWHSVRRSSPWRPRRPRSAPFEHQTDQRRVKALEPKQRQQLESTQIFRKWNITNKSNQLHSAGGGL